MTSAACQICGNQEWSQTYFGPIRDGVFGNQVDCASISRCAGCGVDRLAESFCLQDEAYETAEYRRKLQQGLDSASYFATHDELQIHTLRAVWPMATRNSVIADIGCAGGSLLDHLRGVSATQLAIEPSDIFAQSLNGRGYKHYRYARDAQSDWEGKVQFAFSIQVIEHLADPVDFLKEIRPLLCQDGRLVISTPNREDILMELLPSNFPAFFYRTVHRWYFDARSLAACATQAGFNVLETRFVHRFGMANSLAWLRDRKPTGRAPMSGIGPAADDAWRSYLETAGRADCIFMVLAPAQGVS